MKKIITTIAIALCIAGCGPDGDNPQEQSGSASQMLKVFVLRYYPGQYDPAVTTLELYPYSWSLISATPDAVFSWSSEIEFYSSKPGFILIRPLLDGGTVSIVYPTSAIQ